MNQFGVLTTPQECEGHEEWTYETIKKEGRYELELQFRAWYRKAFSMGLICYFLDKDGNRVKLFCFRHKVNGEDIYNPKKSEIDFEKVEDGTKWICTVGPSKKGAMEWKDAEMVA